jgi:cytochrome c oxidase subunit 4
MTMSTATAGHVVPPRVYYAIFATLIVLTAVTVYVAFIDLGPFNSIAALAIAVTKATLVMLYFMHVRYSTRLTWVVVIGGFFWLGIMLTLTLSDYLTRGWMAYP